MGADNIGVAGVVTGGPNVAHLKVVLNFVFINAKEEVFASSNLLIGIGGQSFLAHLVLEVHS